MKPYLLLCVMLLLSQLHISARSENPYATKADMLVYSLINQFMDENRGIFYITPNKEESELNTLYWQQAHAIDVLIYDYERVKGSNPTLARQYESYFQRFVNNHGNNWGSSDSFSNTFTDDMCWIGLSLLHMAEATGNNDYYYEAKSLYDNDIALRKQKDNRGTFLPWKNNKDKDSGPNACTLSPASLFAAKLYNHTKESKYLTDAIDFYNFMVNNICSEDGRVEEPPLTYTQGTLAEACRQLYHITGESKYLDKAWLYMLYAFTSGRIVDNGLLRDEGPSMDQGIFKAVLMPYAANFVLDTSLDYGRRMQLMSLMKRNGDALWENLDTSRYPAMYCNFYWGEPWDYNKPGHMGAMTSGASLMVNLARLGDTSADIAFTITNGTGFGEDQGANKLMDGRLDTKWCKATRNNTNHKDWGYSYALITASEPIHVTGYTFTTADDTKTYPGRNPYEWVLYGTNNADAYNRNDWNSEDGWTKLSYVNANKTMGAENFKSYFFRTNPSRTAYKYFKLVIKSIGDNDMLQLAEFSLSYAKTPDVCYDVIASKEGFDGQKFDRVLDGESDTKLCGWKGGAYIVFSAPAPITPYAYTIHSAADADNYSVRNPKAFRLYGANGAAPTSDGSTDGWTLIDQQTNASLAAGRYTLTDFNIANPAEYQYFMFAIDDVNSGDMVQMDELILQYNDDPYVIITDQDMADFATHVNSGYTKTNAIVCHDVKAVTPIGLIEDTRYLGTFDGRGHTITLNISSAEDNIGLFGCVGPGATIRNFITKGGVNGNEFVGGIAGRARGGGNITFMNLGNEASVRATGANAGGILGCNFATESTIVMKNCYNAGTIAGGKESAGISGWLGNDALLENCYNTGSVAGMDGRRSFARGNNPHYTNCFTTLDCEEAGGLTNHYPTAKVTSGELCHELGEAFTQDLSRDDAYPTFGSLKVNAGKWFGNANDVYYNKEADVYTVNQLTLNESSSLCNMPAGVRAKHVLVNRTLKAGVWNTFCLPFSMDKPAGWTVKELQSVTERSGNYTLDFAEANGGIQAGVPYMVRTDDALSQFELTDKVSAEMSPVTVGDVTFAGVYASGKAPMNTYVISNNSFVYVDADKVNLKAFRGYITVNASNARSLNYVLDEYDDADAVITGLEDSNAGVAEIYNVAGQRLTKVQKGINIINGKKIMY